MNQVGASVDVWEFKVGLICLYVGVKNSERP